VRIDLPSPRGALTADRTVDGELGLFLVLSGGRCAAFEALAGEAHALRQESGLDLSFEIRSSEPFKASIAVKHKAGAALSEADQRARLEGAAIHMLTLLRPRSAAFVQAAE